MTEPRRSPTRDDFIIAEALATAIVALTDLPAELPRDTDEPGRPHGDILSMREMLESYPRRLVSMVVHDVKRRFGERGAAALSLADEMLAEAVVEA